MAEPRFVAVQRAFTGRIRDPERVAVPAGVEPRRMKIYEDLFFNNLVSLLGGTFPVLSKLYGETRWQALIRDFMVRHRAHTPLFPELPQELLAFLRETRVGRPDDPPFALELAHYEWVELALDIATETIDLAGVDRDGDLLAGVPAVNPLAWALAYDYPVHRLGPDFQPREPGPTPTFLVVYRDLDDQVRFMEINAVTARLIELAQSPENGLAGRDLLRMIAGELAHPSPDAVLKGGAETLALLRSKDVVLGAKR